MARKVVKGVNDLLTWCIYNKPFGDILLCEWTGLDTEGNRYDIGNIARGSKKHLVWKCQTCGHKWPTTPKDRIFHKTNCPKCSVLKRTNTTERILLEPGNPNYSEPGDYNHFSVNRF